MCEYFGTKHEQYQLYQLLMAEHGWAEPKSLELHSWCQAILNFPKNSRQYWPWFVKKKKDILNACTKIRHSEVYRQSQDAGAIFKSFEAGVGLARIHQDSAVVRYIRNLEADFQAIVDDISSQKQTEQAQLMQGAMERTKTQLEACCREAGEKLTDSVDIMSNEITSITDEMTNIDDFSEPDIGEMMLEAKGAETVPFADLPL
ncbi:hypothetical protein TSTA_099240 [Talaromyces stipitatus ATCC 10500]|uniref:Uncharacterized protein n=1 Tax=Talaromyces stipitatus (strain ATCC 10500 / CBS 375.48 / QM 6759 / NRRL 1006) TaxID=441959 RepID=B8MMB7_TALSN|nr:uncharacterized protein TSTA_099240 [Talaromyces stipitatus ATCC 10500]EED13671.1 hypothetical protein TSTA_099240 [Talaromyces stipitatus ATCC 10500]